MEISRVFTRSRCISLLIFSIAFLVRALPEFLSGPYPVGYDLLAGYAPSILAFPDSTPTRLFGWAWSPMTVLSSWSFWMLSGANLLLFLKVAGPFFYGLLVLSFHYLLSKGLSWSSKKGLFTALIFLLQPAVLRTGWDQLREELGLVFFFLLLTRIKCDFVDGARSKPLVVLTLSLLVVFSHPLVAVLLFVVILWQLFDGGIKVNRTFLRVLVVAAPSAAVFICQLYSQFSNPWFSSHFSPLQLPTGSNNFVFTNYFLNDPRFLSGDYWKVLTYVGSLSLYAVIPLIPLAVKGFFKDRVFTPMMIWLIIASYSIVVFPWYALSAYWWWIFLLPIPLTIYLGDGLERIGVFGGHKRFKVAVVCLAILSVVALGYATSIIRLGNPYAYYYMPSGLVESSIPFKDVPSAQNTFTWINENVAGDAIIIVPEKMQGLAYMYLKSSFRIRVAPPIMNLDVVIERIDAEKSGAYAVYYLDEVGNSSNVEILTKEGNLGVFLIHTND
jgi:hypothetical protein